VLNIFRAGFALVFCKSEVGMVFENWRSVANSRNLAALNFLFSPGDYLLVLQKAILNSRVFVLGVRTEVSAL
jgi:hypothetical protein